MKLKKLRLEKGLTQEKASQLLGVSRRTYVTYEKDESKISPIKLEFFLHTLEKYGIIDETHGVLTLDTIKEICADVLKLYNVEYAYLFGSYAKGNATEVSDVDLLVSMPINGLAFYELIETLRERLKKKVDLLDIAQLNNNPKLVQEILRDGVKIYG
ncbi:MAG: nucleotidyltransferase domain-containing protein [Clostridia bacterium]|nr:nucleotidyltransferase domain-containing protein [Clostridia bacterium]